MIALIDGDIVAYRCAASVLDYEPVDLAMYRTEMLLRQIIDTTQAENYFVFIKGGDNFRYKIYPEYKANRRDLVEPKYLEDCNNYLMDEWGAIQAWGCEADDLLGINQADNTIICSIDKDLLTIPGRHHNFVRMENTFVTKQDALRTFYKQMMIGDRGDNLFGVDKIGKVKAAKLIDPLDDEQDMFDVVYNKYNNDAKRFVTNANCFWIMQRKDELWVNRQNLTLPSECQQEVDQQLKFMKSLNQTTSTELGTNRLGTCGILVNGDGTEAIQTNDQPLT